MVIATVTYNGFFTGELGLDSKPRLVVIMLYFGAYLSHGVYVWYSFKKYVRNIISIATWRMLRRANFAGRGPEQGPGTDHITQHKNHTIWAKFCVLEFTTRFSLARLRLALRMQNRRFPSMRRLCIRKSTRLSLHARST